MYNLILIGLFILICGLIIYNIYKIKKEVDETVPMDLVLDKLEQAFNPPKKVIIKEELLPKEVTILNKVYYNIETDKLFLSKCTFEENKHIEYIGDL